MNTTSPHLTDVELLAIAERESAAEGPAIAPEAAHLETCVSCREKLAEITSALEMAAVVEVPEPSPLFWDHFSSRVRSEVQAIDPNAGGWRTWLSGTPLRAAVATAIVVLIGFVVWHSKVPSAPDERLDTTIAASGSGVRSVPPDSAEPDADADGAWALVRAVADDVSWDEVIDSGWIAPPGSADDAALGLTAEERVELVQLLRAETKRSGA